MSTSTKQVYIPTLKITGSFMEEIGGSADRVIYPGKTFSLDLAPEDFKDSEEYHSVWISITKAVKSKLTKDASG